jgi:hypothetical protein
MNRVRRAAAGTAAVLALTLASACGDGDDVDGAPAVDTGATAEDSGNDGGGGNDNRGNGTAGDAGLPADWPDRFPPPPAGAVFDDLRGPVAQDDRIIYIVDYLAADGDLSDIFTYYLEALPAAGWEGNFDADPTAAAVVATVIFSGDGASGEVFLDDNRGPVLIRVQMYLDR